jgi:DNA-binding XRE family transcriptional regulator
MNIGENIKKMRIAKGMTQDEFATKVGITQPMVAHIERGTRAVTMQLGKQIAEVFECTLEDLF